MIFVKKIASRYLWSKKSEAFISVVSVFAVLGVALGVAVLNITMAIMNGFEDELQENLVGTSHIFIGRIAGAIPESQKLYQTVKNIQEIKSFTPYVQGQVMLTSKNFSHGLVLKGTQEYQDQKPLPGIVLGKSLRPKLGIYPGQKIGVLSPQVVSSPFGLSPRVRSFEVADFYDSGLYGYEEGLAYTSLASAQKFFRLQGQISGIEISLFHPEKAQQVKTEIQEKLRELELYDYYVQDWTELNSGVWEAIALEKRAYFIVLLLLIVLASFSIVTTLIMIVLEKRKDIAILRTVGATAKHVRNIFLLMGCTIGFMGTVLGLILGLLGALALREFGFPLPENVFPTDTLPVKLSWENFLITGVAAWVICTLATVYPARRASKLQPCEILRYE